MSSVKDTCEVIRRVLSHDGLRWGGWLVARRLLEHELLPGGCNVEVFDIDLKGIGGDIAETVLIWNPSTTDHSAIIAAFLDDCTGAPDGRRVPFVVVGTEQGFGVPMGVESLDHAEFFRRLCSIPPSLGVSILNKAGPDFDFDEYNKRFQGRELKIIHHPDWLVEGGARAPRDVYAADEYLATWASARRRRHPLLVIGERGSGKSFQLIRWCQDLNDRHQQSPWEYGPAFFVELRRLGSQRSAYRRFAPCSPDAILQEYPDVCYRWGTPLLEAFLTVGHTVVCVDGLEEVDEVSHGDDRTALAYFRRLCSSLPLGSRFILSCRKTQFGSIDNLLCAESWPGKNVGSTFEVVELLPFKAGTSNRYLSIPDGNGVQSNSLNRLAEAVSGVLQDKCGNLETNWQAGAWEAVKLCSRYPGLLAAMRRAAEDWSSEAKPKGKDVGIGPTELLQAALVEGVIAYNLDYEKAQRSPGYGAYALGTDERLELLGQLVFHLAARGESFVVLDAVPPVIALRFGLDLEPVRRDIRIHTLFEAVSPDEVTGFRYGPETSTAAESAPLAFRLAVRPSDAEEAPCFPQPFCATEDTTLTNALPRTESDRSTALTQAAAAQSPIGATSVSGAFLLAEHVARTLARSAAIPLPKHEPNSVGPIPRLRALGEVPLSVPAAGILRELLERDGAWRQGCFAAETGDLQVLVRATEALIAISAQRGDLSVFCSGLRYLGHNLEAMGLISQDRRHALDPWLTNDVGRIPRTLKSIPDYEMTIVPHPKPQALPLRLTPTSLADRGRILADSPPGEGGAFLMGRGEITNEHFATFLESQEGSDWRIENVTIAGSRALREPSTLARFVNEYYLYFWEPNAQNASTTYRFPPETARYPVVYLSWYACAAFCDWLTAKEGHGTPVYANYFAGAGLQRAENLEEPPKNGFRLPSPLEWSWAARGGRLDVEYPWELYPFILPHAQYSAFIQNAANPHALWLQSWRDAYQTTLTQKLKGEARTVSDPFNPLGLSGMMGNVKEWCHNAIDPAPMANRDECRSERVILGSTGFLGPANFEFDYAFSLFPENTNPDVGFRICRPLLPSEVGAMTSREAELASLVTPQEAAKRWAP